MQVDITGHDTLKIGYFQGLNLKCLMDDKSCSTGETQLVSYLQ